MKVIIHDPSEYIKGIYSILINNKKRIGFLFGAGTSIEFIPAIKQLTEIIEKEILEKKGENEEVVYDEIVQSLKLCLGDKYNIESILSLLEQRHEIIGTEKISGIDKEGYKVLILMIKKIIRREMSIHTGITKHESLIQSNFARWIGQADRAFGIEIFTTNYDYLFELGLEFNNIPYYDGFSGSYRPFFNSDSIEKFQYLPFQTKLWKIHGSIGWHIIREKEEANEKIVRDNSDNDDIFIFPSIFKYKDSQKQPYISLLDRLYNFLKEDDTVLFTCGYAFNDEHINGKILSALNTGSNSHVIALYYDEVKNKETGEFEYLLNSNCNLNKLALGNSKISALGFRSAIIGKQLGKWKLRKEPDNEETPQVNEYFDEDAYTDKTENLNQESKGKEIWSGEGKFILSDFAKFVKFLNSMIVENELSNSIKNGNK